MMKFHKAGFGFQVQIKRSKAAIIAETINKNYSKITQIMITSKIETNCTE